MLAKRIVATLLIKNGLLVKGKQFKNDRVIGSIMQTVNVFQQRGIDEMIILDIDATRENRIMDCDLINEITASCFMPLGFGGGVRTIEDARALLCNGADKIVVGSNANPKFIKKLAENLGSQSIAITVDYKNNKVHLYNGQYNTYWPVLDYIKMLENCGAGEIILQSINHDGEMNGYDYKTIKKVCENTDLPVVASCGAGTSDHIRIAFDCGASGATAASIWQFTGNTPKNTKEYLRQQGYEVRL